MFLLRQNEGIQQKLDYFFEINGEQWDPLSLYKHMYPMKIEMSWKMVYILDVGKELYKLFNRFPRGVGRRQMCNTNPYKHW
jgi:hypothetical protein